MSDTLLSPTFLFRYSVPCLRYEGKWSSRGLSLKEEHAVPAFGELEQRPVFAEVRVGWNDDGLLLAAIVKGKSKSLWCRSTRIEDSDGLHVWIDTRDTHNIHRASRFCHRFAFLPQGGGQDQNTPLGRLVAIHRAREEPKPVADKVLKVTSAIRQDGYRLQARIPAAALTGFDPDEHPHLGFTYAVVDRELGWQTFTLGPEFPIAEDPSLWGTLELEK